jgi:hypothetical protein
MKAPTVTTASLYCLFLFVIGLSVSTCDGSSAFKIEILEGNVKVLMRQMLELTEKVRVLTYENKELSINLDNLQVASRELLFEKHVDLEEIQELEDFERGEEGEVATEADQDEMGSDAPPNPSGRALSLWYLLKSAEAGHAVAQLQLGIYYDSGYSGLNHSSSAALEWYLKAARQNLPEAQCYVGMAYHTGRGTNQSDDLALKWYLVAALNGDSIAQNNFGWMLLTGGMSDCALTLTDQYI